MLLYPGFTPLDAIGPYHALSQFPGYEFCFVALNAGPISDGSATIMQAQKSISEISAVDILVVPGGQPAITMARACRAHLRPSLCGKNAVRYGIRPKAAFERWTPKKCACGSSCGAARPI